VAKGANIVAIEANIVAIEANIVAREAKFLAKVAITRSKGVTMATIQLYNSRQFASGRLDVPISTPFHLMVLYHVQITLRYCYVEISYSSHVSQSQQCVRTASRKHAQLYNSFPYASDLREPDQSLSRDYAEFLERQCFQYSIHYFWRPGGHSRNWVIGGWVFPTETNATPKLSARKR
jgi:hypothetical protein